jgi:hypothetical protein
MGNLTRGFTHLPQLVRYPLLKIHADLTDVLTRGHPPQGNIRDPAPTEKDDQCEKHKPHTFIQKTFSPK